MKRSEVNQILHKAEAFIQSHGFVLPPLAGYPPDELRDKRADLADVIAARMGWDITDYGLGDFDQTGLVLFTLRNGRIQDLIRGRGMLYAEKLLISRRNQLSPMHTHLSKTEDIINRGGAPLIFELFGSDENGAIDPHSPVRFPRDRVSETVPAGGRISLQPGESITLFPGVWHAFWPEDGDTLIGEVSTVNDDMTDNIFREPIARFSDLVENEPPYRLLVSDYDRWLAPAH